ncbi:catalase [Mycolicibacterium cyprinidarum]|uniref:Catalase n=1 Tax=Mycolicibacterium cyprinidarum TaxID=2860311 RepID=A0ABQ4V8P0_9MYCO|nr:catalase [Mycolicibacterium sp. NGTWSNA01]GJF15663.1 catalase [Mycolicibacterium sp. NGTWS1803]GJF19454.1 catalase [Mycolicibacterium sp. NGTWS0302]
MTASKSGSTTGSGAPAASDRNSLTVGSNGPIVLHDVHFLEQMAHFNRERVPERSPHAKGSGAFGILKVTEDVSQYTKAALFQQGAETDLLVRFSTVAGEQGSPDTWRDVRGYSMKFYTSEGNYDLVGNNTPIFFLRDPIKFPHFIRSQKRLADSGLRSAQMQWDFWTLNPESAHQVTYLMGQRGLPKTWRHMNGYGSHTYMWINAGGEKFWVKYHFHTEQGMEFFTNAEAATLAGEDADFHRRDLFDAIARGDHPSWRLSVQVMPYAEAADYRFNPFDLTKTWSHADYPLIAVGTYTLNRNPENFFAEIEQAAFSPGNTVPGIGLSPDKMLLGRAFAYNDAQRNRIGTNFHQLPVNQPRKGVTMNTYMFDGQMTYHHAGDAAVYAPNSTGRPWADVTGPAEDGWEADGDLLRSAYALHSEDDDFGQAGTLVREVWDDAQRAAAVETISGALAGGVTGEVLDRALQYWRSIDADLGARIEKTVRQGG